IFHELDGLTRLIHPRRATLRKFDIYLTADLLWTPLPRGARRVNVSHGVAGKYGDTYDRPSRAMREWDRIFFINGRRLNNYVSAGAIESKAARLVGMPKVDCLCDGTLKRNDVLGAL